MPKDFAGVMHEFKHHQLHSGSPHGPVVTNPAQAKAIAVSEQQQMGHAGGSSHAANVRAAIHEHAKSHVPHPTTGGH